MQRLIATAVSPRDRVLMRLLVETGMRRAEAATLAWQDVDLHRGLIVVQRGKGGKQRIVPFTPALAEDFARLGVGSGDGFVLQSRQARRLSVRQVNRIVCDLGRRAGVKHPDPNRQHLTCHLMRHTFARLWKANGGSIESLSKILGHSSVKTTWDVYGTESLPDVQRNYDDTIRRMYAGEQTSPAHPPQSRTRKGKEKP